MPAHAPACVPQRCPRCWQAGCGGLCRGHDTVPVVEAGMALPQPSCGAMELSPPISTDSRDGKPSSGSEFPGQEPQQPQGQADTLLHQQAAGFIQLPQTRRAHWRWPPFLPLHRIPGGQSGPSQTQETCSTGRIHPCPQGGCCSPTPCPTARGGIPLTSQSGKSP